MKSKIALLIIDPQVSYDSIVLLFFLSNSINENMLFMIILYDDSVLYDDTVYTYIYDIRMTSIRVVPCLSMALMQILSEYQK